LSSVGAVILAAGRSSRFLAAGGKDTKLVAKLDGRPIVRLVAEAALASTARPVIVVTGSASLAVNTALAGLDLEIVFNPDYSLGISSSLKAGLAVLPPNIAGALILLGDMPRIDAPLLDGLIAAFLSNKRAIAAAPSFQGQRGNPILLGRSLFERAKRLEGDEGARRLFAALDPAEFIETPTSNAGVLFDIDTPDDLATGRSDCV
jgi:molybdenum cofactor cytidylyltransferase